MITVAIKLRLNRLGLNTTRVSSVSSHDYLRGLQCDGGCVTLGLRAGRERLRHRAHSSQTKMRGGRGGRGRGDYTPHKDAPFVVFLCYRPPRDVPYRELDDEVGVGRVARTFVTRKDRKCLVITEMIIH